MGLKQISKRNIEYFWSAAVQCTEAPDFYIFIHTVKYSCMIKIDAAIFRKILAIIIFFKNFVIPKWA